MKTMQDYMKRPEILMSVEDLTDHMLLSARTRKRFPKIANEADRQKIITRFHKGGFYFLGQFLFCDDFMREGLIATLADFKSTLTRFDFPTQRKDKAAFYDYLEENPDVKLRLFGREIETNQAALLHERRRWLSESLWDWHTHTPFAFQTKENVEAALRDIFEIKGPVSYPKAAAQPTTHEALNDHNFSIHLTDHWKNKLMLEWTAFGKGQLVTSLVDKIDQALIASPALSVDIMDAFTTASIAAISGQALPIQPEVAADENPVLEIEVSNKCLLKFGDIYGNDKETALANNFAAALATKELRDTALSIIADVQSKMASMAFQT